MMGYQVYCWSEHSVLILYSPVKKMYLMVLYPLYKIVPSSVIAYSQKCSLIFVTLLMTQCVPKHAVDKVVYNNRVRIT
jgi:hypothetical protein